MFSNIIDLMQKVATKREVGKSEMRMINKFDLLSSSVEDMRIFFTILRFLRMMGESKKKVKAKKMSNTW